MKKFSSIDELKEEMLKNKEQFIGKTAIVGGGFKFLIVDITKKQIKAFPLESLIKMRKEELREYLELFFTPDKIETAIAEVECLKKDISQSYV